MNAVKQMDKTRAEINVVLLRVFNAVSPFRFQRAQKHTVNTTGSTSSVEIRWKAITRFEGLAKGPERNGDVSDVSTSMRVWSTSKGKDISANAPF